MTYTYTSTEQKVLALVEKYNELETIHLKYFLRLNIESVNTVTSNLIRRKVLARAKRNNRFVYYSPTRSSTNNERTYVLKHKKQFLYIASSNKRKITKRINIADKFSAPELAEATLKELSAAKKVEHSFWEIKELT